MILDDVSLKPYTAVDSVHTDPLDPMPVYEASNPLAEFPQEAADALMFAAGPGSGSPQVLVEVRQMGGAIAREGEHESAFCSRDAAYSLLIVGVPMIPGAEEQAAEILRTMRPWTGGHRLPNFNTEPERYDESHDSATQARLRAAIRAYDPSGVMAIGHVLDL